MNCGSCAHVPHQAGRSCLVFLLEKKFIKIFMHVYGNDLGYIFLSEKVHLLDRHASLDGELRRGLRRRQILQVFCRDEIITSLSSLK